MGIPTPDPDTPYGANCLLCWPVNQTPLNVWVCFQGIECSQWWFALCGPAPNGTYLLPQDGGNPCLFRDLTPAHDIIYNAAAGLLTFDIPPFFMAFDSQGNPACSKFFSNQNNPPVDNTFWAGGQAVVFDITVGGSTSIHEVFDSLNIEHDVDNLADMFPGSPTKMDLRYAKKDRSDSIIIQFDPTKM